MRKLKIILPTVLAISSLPLVSLVSCGAPKAENFETDPWSTVCYYANKGIVALCNAYNHKGHPEWFVGKTRDVTLNGQIHKVKVVGINQDFTDTNNQKPVALTFQFNNLISKSADGSFLSIKWQEDISNADNHNYWNSTLKNVLNSEKDVNWDNDESEHQSVYSMIKEGDSSLAKNIKTVYRGVNVFDESLLDYPYKNQIEKTKIFCPTLSNVFSIKSLNNSYIYNAGPAQRKLYKLEGQEHMEDESVQYMFYQKEIADKLFCTESSSNATWTEFSCLKLKDCSTGDVNGESWYWFSSPILYDTKRSNVWISQSDGKISDNTNVGSSGAIAPCFCI